jgi:hypothetical protein
MRRRPIHDGAVIEAKLRSMPWADDGSVFERAFGQWTAEVRTLMGKRAHVSVLPNNEEVFFHPLH